MLQPPVSIAGEQVILTVIVNGYDEGKFFFTVTEDNDILASTKFLSSIRLRSDLWEIKKNKISLRSLAPNIQFKVDPNEPKMFLFVKPYCFEPQNIRPDIAKNDLLPSQPVHSPRSFSAYLNHQQTITYYDGFGFQNYTLPMEIGVNRGQWFLNGNFQLNYDEQHIVVSRQLTNLTRDNPSRLTRLIIGDFYAPSSNLLSGGLFGGVTWKSNFTLDRTFNPFSDLQVDTYLDTPTTAELYKNGHMVNSWDLLPGPVNFSDLDIYAGPDAKFILRDLYGREQTIKLPALIHGSKILKEGVHEYSYSAGYKRDRFGNDQYDKLSLLGFHRYGITMNFTQGLHFSFKDDFVNIGPTAGYRDGDNILNFEGMYSFFNKDDGYAVSLTHSYINYNFSSKCNLRIFSKDYVHDVDILPGSFEPHKYKGELSVNYSWPWFGSISVGYFESEWWNDTKNSEIVTSYNKKIFNSLNLSINFRVGLQDSFDNQIVFHLSYIPIDKAKKEYFDNISFKITDQKYGDFNKEMRIQRSSPSGPGLGYNFSLNQKENKVSGTGRADYKNNYFHFNTHIFQTIDGIDTYSFGAAGGIALLDGELFFGRPVIDSFAIVELEGADNVPIYRNGGPVGTIDDGDSLLVSSLISYGNNTIFICPADLPISTNFSEKKQIIKNGQRSGSRLTFKGRKYSAVEGYIYHVLPNNQRAQMTAIAIDVEISGNKQIGFTGEKGYFYLENIPAGNHLLYAHLFEGDCVANLSVPKHGDMIKELGELSCESVK